jgi:hypothetical protein
MGMTFRTGTFEHSQKQGLTTLDHCWCVPLFSSILYDQCNLEDKVKQEKEVMTFFALMNCLLGYDAVLFLKYLLHNDSFAALATAFPSLYLH